MRPFALIAILLLLGCSKRSPIEKILSEPDEDKATLELNKLLWNKAENKETLMPLNTEEKNILYIQLLEAEINNGGFDQYFFNGSGEYTYETLDALQKIKAGNTVAILQQAINAFPTHPIPKNTQERRLLMNELPEDISYKWDSLDQQFYSYPDKLNKLILDYVRINKKQFE